MEQHETTPQWITTTELIVGKTTFPSTINKILLFDLDSTLIKTKSGKRFPTDKNDWVLFNENVIPFLTSTKNTFIGIITNQGGLKTPEKQQAWMEKLNDISKLIPIHWISASIGHKTRKPFNKPWLILKEELNTNCTNITYIGDAFGRRSNLDGGRPNDFSDTDLKFALNCGFKYKTPELFFKQNNYIPTDFTLTIPDLQYYSEQELDQQIFNKITPTPDMCHQIIMVGLPASGKTTLRNMIMDKYKNHKIAVCNNDENKKFTSLAPQIYKRDWDIFIIDDTNLVSNQIMRVDGIRPLSGSILRVIQTIFIEFNHPPLVLKHLNALRCYRTGIHIQDVVYNTLNKKTTPILLQPTDELIVIDKLFPQMKCDDLLYYV